MKQAAKKAKNSNFLDHKALRTIINAFLFLANFLLFYFIWIISFPGTEGLSRVFLCWILAYATTWIIAHNTKGTTRLFITLVFIALLIFVLMSRPPI